MTRYTQSNPSAFASSLLGTAGKAAISDHIWKNITNQPLCYFPITEAEASDIARGFGGPSPDDVVLSAQKGDNNPNRTYLQLECRPKLTQAVAVRKAVKKSAREEDVTKHLSGLSINDSPSKAKPNVLSLYRSSDVKPCLNFVVIGTLSRVKSPNFTKSLGHVDAGKSTLMGRLLYDIGAISERSMQKNMRDSSTIGKSSFAFAWVLDQTDEERERSALDE